MASNHLTEQQRRRKANRAAREAISRGVRLGRRPTFTAEQVSQIVRLYDKDMETFRSIAEVMRSNAMTVQRAYINYVKRETGAVLVEQYDRSKAKKAAKKLDLQDRENKKMLTVTLTAAIAALAIGEILRMGNIEVSRWDFSRYRTAFAGSTKHNDNFTPAGAAKRVFEYAKLPEFKGKP